MDENEGLYYDVSDNEILEMVETYPQILEGSDMLMSRYKDIMKLIQFDRDIINDTTFNKVSIC
jgi:hypothetical protein